MSDYQVTYENHHDYCNKKAKLSPVRFFTNIEAPGLHLPLEDGYKYCSLCLRYVSRLNEHCDMCGKCTSKDGRPYKHCNDCNKCVKESWDHCSECNTCQLIGHDCQVKLKDGCYRCGSSEHKQRHCTSRPKMNFIRKRKSNIHDNYVSIKKKTK
jgi:hypothetical protein